MTAKYSEYLRIEPCPRSESQYAANLICVQTLFDVTSFVVS
jgi:hypothetical protein